jgi:SAM-dependent methyltransferase
MSDDYWEDPERVERFAGRDPDHRLVELLASYADPGTTTVLDLGCAGGRNTEMLARGGFQVHALDAARAMVARTRERIAPFLGEEVADQRVRLGRMDRLPFPDAFFDLVVALGVHHSARSSSEWERAVSETARVLVDGGLLLFSQFTPDTDLTGGGVTPVAGEAGVYEGLPGGPSVLVDAPTLDSAMAGHGLRPEVPTDTATTQLEVGRRVSVNGLYRKG